MSIATAGSPAGKPASASASAVGRKAPSATLGALTILGAQAEAQIRVTVRHALEAGATQREIAEVIYQMSMFGGLPAMQKALEIAQGVFGEEDEE